MDAETGLESQAKLAADCVGELPPELVREEFVRSLIDAVPAALVISDVKGCILAVNQAACAIFGYDETEMLHHNVSMLMPSPDHEQHDTYIEAYRRTGKRRIIGIGRFVTAKHKSGKKFPVELTIGEVASDGSPGFVAILRDLSIDEERHQKLSELRSEITQVYRVSAVGLLASAIAHEVNQPLAAIRNYVETLHDLAGENEPIANLQLRKAMEACSNEAERAGEIVRRLRQFMSRGETELDRCSLSELVEDGIALALPESEAKNVEVKLKLDPAADSVLVDGIQIEQVIFNLTRNALQAMAEVESPTIEVTTRQREAMSEVVVEDAGPGVAMKVVEHLFMPFNSTKPEGLGVGLSICRAIVEAHGGQIWVTHTKRGGAAFHFTVLRDLDAEGTKE